jgi:hypothetical protein
VGLPRTTAHRSLSLLARIRRGAKKQVEHHPTLSELSQAPIRQAYDGFCLFKTAPEKRTQKLSNIVDLLPATDSH